MLTDQQDKQLEQKQVMVELLERFVKGEFNG